MAVTDADYLFKEKYAKKLANLLTEHDKLQMAWPFIQSEAVGGVFVQAVDLEYEHGFTFGGNQRSPTLATAIPAVGAQARLIPSQIIGQKDVGYRDLFRTEGNGDKAFAALSEKQFRDLALGMRRNIEISTLHGQGVSGIGVVSSLAGQDIHIAPAFWAPGIWTGGVGMRIDVYLANGTTIRQADLIVTAVNMDSLTDPFITVTGTTTGIIAGDVIFRDTAVLGSPGGVNQEAMGLIAMLQTTGSIHGIPTVGHPLWDPNLYPVGGPLNSSHLVKGAYRNVVKGASGGALAIVPTRAFESLNEQVMSLRSLDASYGPNKFVNGAEALEFHSQVGKMVVMPHIMMFESQAAIVPLDQGVDDPEMRAIRRIGSVDMTFERPKPNAGRIFIESSTTAGYSIRNYTDQAPFFSRPGHCTLLTGITYP